MVGAYMKVPQRFAPSLRGPHDVHRHRTQPSPTTQPASSRQTLQSHVHPSTSCRCEGSPATAGDFCTATAELLTSSPSHAFSTVVSTKSLVRKDVTGSPPRFGGSTTIDKGFLVLRVGPSPMTAFLALLRPMHCLLIRGSLDAMSTVTTVINEGATRQRKSASST